MSFEARKRENISSKQIKADYPSGNKRKLKKYYTRQNELIDQFLGAGDEERLGVAEDIKMGPKIKFAINASFGVNFCLFCIQLYAAVSTGSLSLFATAADAFVSLFVTSVLVSCTKPLTTRRWILCLQASCSPPREWQPVLVCTNIPWAGQEWRPSESSSSVR